ncbi:MAG: DNA translocase FtsK 4TM domain-containing protein [Pseudomonadota bacterium]
MTKSMKKLNTTRFHLTGSFREIVSLLLLGIAIFCTFSLVTYNPHDPSISTIWVNKFEINNNVSNLTGILGAYFADILMQTVGLSAYFLIALIYVFGLMLFFKRPINFVGMRFMGLIFLLFSISSLCSALYPELQFYGTVIESGGIIGVSITSAFFAFFGYVGSLILLFMFLSIGILLTFQFSFYLIISFVVLSVFEFVLKTFQAIIIKKNLLIRKHKDRKILSKNFISEIKEVILPSNNEEKVVKKVTRKQAQAKEVKKQPVQNKLPFIDSDYGYKLPPASLLDTPPPGTIKVDDESLVKNSRLVEKKLADFGVEGKITEIKPGPIITMYEFEPAPGIKLNKIVSLSDDLAMAMRALSIRIIAPIPGKSVVGIEIPNNRRETVFFSDLIKNTEFEPDDSKINFVIGKDTEGSPVYDDLCRMPHLLVAGATGSGKSVFINSVITSILYSHTALTLRFILIDPKMLELSIYNKIPHMLLPVVTDAKKAVAALRWATKEMEERYNLMSKLGARNINGCNKKIDAINKLPLQEREKELESIGLQYLIENSPNNELVKMPFIVVIVDELADLIMVAGKEIEELITRLAQMARASGIHLILATQRPSTDVITGLIKANFPARISFQVASKYDSRTILDTIGSESLLGSGDMLYLPPGTSKLDRHHGTYISDREIADVVNFLKDQKAPEYKEVKLVEEAYSSEGFEMNFDEFDEDIEIYKKAVEFVSETGKASISMIQRRLRIGYNRAARMIEKMEAEGIVGPSDGVRQREVLIGQNSRAQE